MVLPKATPLKTTARHALGLDNEAGSHTQVIHGDKGGGPVRYYAEVPQRDNFGNPI